MALKHYIWFRFSVFLLTVAVFSCADRKKEYLREFSLLNGRVNDISAEVISNRPNWRYREIDYEYRVGKEFYKGRCRLQADIRIIRGQPIAIKVAKSDPKISDCDSEATEALNAEIFAKKWVALSSFKRKSEDSRLRFFSAIYGDHRNALSIFLNAGISADTRRNSEPALVYAARLGRKEIVELLLRNGANPNAKNAAGKTAIEESCEFEKVAIVNILREAGARRQCAF